jgi:hypothetical protein
LLSRDGELTCGGQIAPLGAHRALLHALRPNFVVMYDPDLELMRELEVYRASHRGHAVRVYFLVYDESVDIQKYQHAIARERDAFENLIRENSVHTTQGLQGSFVLTLGQIMVLPDHDAVADAAREPSPLPASLRSRGPDLASATKQVRAS